MSVYLDSSFIVSLYGPDANGQSAAETMQATTSPLIVSELCELEAANAFRLRVFRRDATLAQAQRSIDYFEDDLTAGILHRRPLPRTAYQRAHRVSVQHTAQLGIRGADLLHIATALELGTLSLYSFDLQQRKLASAVGLTLNSI